MCHTILHIHIFLPVYLSAESFNAHTAPMLGRHHTLPPNHRNGHYNNSAGAVTVWRRPTTAFIQYPLCAIIRTFIHRIGGAHGHTASSKRLHFWRLAIHVAY